MNYVYKKVLGSENIMRWDENAQVFQSLSSHPSGHFTLNHLVGDPANNVIQRTVAAIQNNPTGFTDSDLTEFASLYSTVISLSQTHFS